jgi:subtilisin family serine protease
MPRHRPGGPPLPIRAARAAFFAAILAICFSPAATAEPAMPAAVAQKLVKGGGGLPVLWSGEAGRLPVIVEFALPDVPDPAGFDGPDEADAAHVQAVFAAQDAILAALLGSPADIAAAEASNETNLKRMSFSPMFGLRASAEDLERLSADPRVLRIHEDAISDPVLIETVPLIGMPTAYAGGATGADLHVAVVDTGGRRDHEFLSRQIVAAACYSTTSPPPNSTTSICPGGVSESINLTSADDCDDPAVFGCGHGTHVAGIAAGFNTNQQAGEPPNGVARSARIISINVFSLFPRAACGSMPARYTEGCLRSFVSDQIRGMERVQQLRNAFPLGAVNLSLGDGSFATACDDDPRKRIIDTLRRNRAATVVSVGNDGNPSEIAAPACISTAIAVAASTKQDARSTFSNWGPLVDLVAPGTAILSAQAVEEDTTSYASLSGTSMAAPHVAGAIAALRSALPDASLADIESALRATGLGVMSEGVNRPRIRVAEALAALTQEDQTTIVAAVTPATRATQVGSTVTAFATILNSGSARATLCGIAPPANAPLIFSYRARNHVTGALGVPDQPVNIPPGGRQDFLMAFTPTDVMRHDMGMVFDCTNTSPALIRDGLNSFLLVATADAPPADILSIAVTASNDGIMNIPLGGTGFAALAAINIGAPAAIHARLSTSSILYSSTSLPGTMVLCRTNPATGACLATPTATVDFTPDAGEVVTFTAFVTSNGTPIPFDPANTRLFVHFSQGSTPVGSASVAARTVTGGDAQPPDETAALVD